MPLITRTGKGSKLTTSEMDGNLDYLKSLSTSISKTYAELETMVSSSSLEPEQMYTISDFCTTYTMPIAGTAFAGPNEPIIIKASGVNTFYTIAHSTLYPEDILYYHFANTSATITLYGFIYRRYDTANEVNIPFDFRSVKFRRYKCDMTSIGMANEYTLWATSVTIGYKATTNSAITLTGDPNDYVDYYAFPNGSNILSEIHLDTYTSIISPESWTPANYNIVIIANKVRNLKLGDYTFNFTLIAPTSFGITDVIGGNINTTIWKSDNFILSQHIKNGFYYGINSAIIYFIDGNQTQDVHWQGFSGYVRAQRLAASSFINSTAWVDVYRARNFSIEGISNFGIGAGGATDTVSGIKLSNNGAYIGVSFGGLNITSFTGADLGHDGTPFIRMGDGTSNIPFTYVITGLTTLNFVAIQSKCLGKAMISSTNATENINSFTNMPSSQTWKVYPNAGLTLTITASATIKLGSGVTTIVLVGGTDWAEFKNVGGVAYLINKMIY